MIQKFAICLFLFTSCFLVNCAANPFKTPPSIKKALRESIIDNSLAIENLEQYINEHPNSPKMALHMVHAGELRRLNNEPQIARRWFESVVELHPTSPEKSAAILGIAVIEMENNFTNENLDTLKIIREEDIPDTLNADRYRLLYIYHAPEDPDLAKVYANKAKMYAQTHPKTKERLTLLFGTEIVESKEEIEPSLGEEDYLAQLAKLIKAKKWEDVISLTETFETEFPDSKHLLLVQAYKARAEAEDPFSQKKVAVLLPLTGKYAPAAKAIQQALEFANTSKLELIFHDTGWEGTKTSEEIRAHVKDIITKVVTEEGCALIIGPLLKEVAPHAAEFAQAYQIPLLSLSKSSAILDSGEHIFSVSIPMDQQVESLLNHAVDDRGWKTFVAMVPDNEYGNNALKVFTEKAEERGGVVLRSVTYDPSSTSFLEEAQELGLKGDFRPSDLDLEEEVSLDTPIIDFDAIFIPDNHRRVPQIVSALAYEEFSLGTFKARQNETVYVMGLNAWNNPSIVDKGGKYLVNGVFVDAFWVGSEREASQEFVTSFVEKFGKNPNIYDALSFDVIQLVTVTLEPSSQSRNDVLEHLNTARIPDPVTGGSYFRSSRELDRVMDIFVIQPTGIELWKPEEDEEK